MFIKNENKTRNGINVTVAPAILPFLKKFCFQIGSICCSVGCETSRFLESHSLRTDDCQRHIGKLQENVWVVCKFAFRQNTSGSCSIRFEEKYDPTRLNRYPFPSKRYHVLPVIRISEVNSCSPIRDSHLA